MAAFGGVSVLINNAGVYPTGPVLTMPVEEWDALMNVNLRAAFICAQAAARQMAGGWARPLGKGPRAMCRQATSLTG